MTQPPAQSTDATDTPAKNYKATLNLPVTDFKMKAGAATREPEIEAMWEAQGVYHQAVALRKKQQASKFVLHDGPPYLSSDKIHIGTALNKILKDIVTRYKFQRGYFAPYIPGYDSHGLPIENAVVKNIKGGRQAISEADLRKQCREFALKNLDGQEANFKRLGVWGDWKKPYITMDASFEATQIKLFYTMYEKGFVYKGLKPVYWSPTSESALAEAEVEYADHTSHSIYVKFPVDNASLEKNDQLSLKQKEWLKDASFVIWTTTPWTLPANLALSIHPDFEYVVIETERFGKLVVAEGLREQFSKHIGLENPKILSTFKGKDIELATAQHPFIESRKVPILLGDHVTLEAGTGIVHTAPGHGMEDYQVCQKYERERPELKIGILSPLDNKGKFDFSNDEEKFPQALRDQLWGKFYEDANLEILDILKQNNVLLKHSTFVHSYPHDWRTHKPVIYRATEQWFISIDKIRDKTLAQIKQVGWIPARGEARITAMVEGRNDWCISRQRVWGVPIPIFYYQDTNEILINQEIIDHLYEQFKIHTSDIWWAKSSDELLSGLPESSRKKYGIGLRTIKKEMDIMDVWFDSGVTHTAVVEARHNEFVSNSAQTTLPVELYLEGSDQHRGWFQSSLLTSVMTNGQAPYKTVLTHGFVLDHQGRKMSKSLGNVVDPNKVMNQYGADILRLWIASVDYTQDIRIGDHVLAQLAETYKKVRNTFRFMLGNLADFNPNTDTLKLEDLCALDRFALYRLQGLVERVTNDFDHYEFHRYNHEIQYFCGNDLSSQYFDIAKDMLYCDKTDTPRRRAIQTVIHQTLLTLLPMLVPIMPHLAEDIWQSMPQALKSDIDGQVPASSSDIPQSVTLMSWPTVNTGLQDETLAQQVQQLFAFRTEAMQALEMVRSNGKIGSALEAKLVISQPQPGAQSAEEIALICLVSQVEFGQPPVNALVTHTFKNSEGNDVLISVAPAEGQECLRCWKHTEQVGKHHSGEALCERCIEAVLI